MFEMGFGGEFCNWFNQSQSATQPAPDRLVFMVRVRMCGSAMVVYLARAELVFLTDIGVAWLELKTGGRCSVTVGRA